jgi:hypothetical protein
MSTIFSGLVILNAGAVLLALVLWLAPAQVSSAPQLQAATTSGQLAAIMSPAGAS